MRRDLTRELIACLGAVVIACATAAAQQQATAPDLAYPTTEESNAAYFRAKAFSQFAYALQAYEVIGFLWDALSPGPRLTVPRPSAEGSQVVFTDYRTCGTPILIPFELSYQEYHKDDAKAGKLWGVVVSNREGSRVEVISRSPSDRAQGIFYEPIGLTLSATGPLLQTYFPGVHDLEVRQIGTMDNLGPLDKSPLLAPRDHQVRQYLVNQFAQTRCVSPGLSPSTGASDAPLVLTARWDTIKPWFYCGRLSRAEYEFGANASQQHPTTVRLFSNSGPEPLAVLTWPPGTDATADSEAEMVVAERALTPEDEKTAGRTGGQPVGCARTIRWSYAKSGSEGLLPKRFEILVEGKTVMQMTFGKATAYSEGVSVDKELRDPIPLGWGNPREDYYRFFKDIWKLSVSGWQHSTEELKPFLERAVAIRNAARALGDTDTLLPAGHFAMDLYQKSNDSAAWETAAEEHLADVTKYADERQVQMDIGWLAGDAKTLKNPGFVRRLHDLLKERARARMEKRKGLGQGWALLQGAGYFESSACFSAARDNASDPAVRREACLGSALALSKLCYQLITQDGWSPDLCKEYLDGARKDYSDWQSSVSAEEKAANDKLVKRIEQALTEAEALFAAK
ncbi:MAG: hypothetical protein HZB26_03650 [Candidatus Hydrogenedentes bacterium]|nr:hypothetical protein [Candidatus Hydrogenedentota bacterium]